MGKQEYNIEPVANLLKLLEKVISGRNLDRQHHRDEFEKMFSYLLQGKDMVDAYERRNAGIEDEQWDKAKVEFKKCLKIN